MIFIAMFQKIKENFKNPFVKGVTSGPKHHFFGFHDLCPWDVSERYMLAMETDFIDRPPQPRDKGKICVVDLSKINGQMSIVTLAETSAWNFHQGCRAQWLPHTKDTVIYNDYDDDNNRFVSIILNVKTREKIILPAPIYAIDPTGTFGLGINFTRLQKYGGYGYRSNVNSQISSVNESFPKNDGIFKIDFKTGKIQLIIRVKDDHFLTHICFNPSGTRICFIDKFRLPDGGFSQNLVTADPDGNNLYFLPGHISHFCWKNDNEILAYGKFSPSIMNLRNKGFFQNPVFKPFLSVARKMRGGLKQRIAGQSYFLLKDKTQEVKRIEVGVMTEDGHPQFSHDGKWVITDTYPDKNHGRILILYDWENKKRIDLGKFKSLPDKKYLENYKSTEPWDISEMRADLHPRWNRSGTQVCFDSVHEGSRQLYVVDVSSLI